MPINGNSIIRPCQNLSHFCACWICVFSSCLIPSYLVDLYFICYSENFRPFVTILKMCLCQVLVQDMGCLCMTSLQLEELHPCFNAQSQQFTRMEKSLILYDCRAQSCSSSVADCCSVASSSELA